MTVSNGLLMPAKIRSAGTLSQNPQKTVMATNIAFKLILPDTTKKHTGRLLGAPNALWPSQPKFWVGHGPLGPPCSHPLCTTPLSVCEQNLPIATRGNTER